MIHSMDAKTIISVDIQEEYASEIPFINKWAKFINKASKTNDIVFLFNGPDLGFPPESEYASWLYEHDIHEDVLDNSTFFDKGYNFFRATMDYGISDDETIALVQYMLNYRINDSRDIKATGWRAFKKEMGVDPTRLKKALGNGEMITLPDLMDFLIRRDNIVLCGGGRNECLREVEIALRAMKKPYEMIEKFVY